MRIQKIALVILMAVAWAIPSHAEDPTALSDERARELLEELTPDSDQPWRTIPWRIELLDGQKTAAESSRPIFIWAMDGHPLGCT